MKYYLSIFISSFAIGILSSCVNTNATAEEPVATAPKTSPVYALQAAALLPGGSLYTPITEGARDTILSKIQKYETQQKDKSNAVSTKSLRNIRYFPVVEIFKDTTGQTRYQASKNIVCLNETSLTMEQNIKTGANSRKKTTSTCTTVSRKYTDRNLPMKR